MRHLSPTGQNMGFSAGFIGYLSVINPSGFGAGERIKRDDTILVFRSKSREPPAYYVDIIKDYEYRATQELDIKGLPVASDPEGNVYMIADDGAGASIIKMKLAIDQHLKDHLERGLTIVAESGTKKTQAEA
jgi:hypothetical protein